jgi:hypothetical protein
MDTFWTFIGHNYWHFIGDFGEYLAFSTKGFLNKNAFIAV